MTKYRVPVRVSVAPVYTYERFVTIEASSRSEAYRKMMSQIGFFEALIHKPGWKPVRPDLDGSVRPHLTTYDTYPDEEHLEEWVREEDKDFRP